MTNAKHAYPTIQVDCKDRVRTFCFDLGALCALESHMINKTGNEKFSATKDFDWNSEQVSNLAILIWAGFFNDAKKDKEVWTVEKATETVDLLGIAQVRGLVVESLSRILTPAQQKEVASLATKTAKGKAKKKKI